MQSQSPPLHHPVPRHPIQFPNSPVYPDVSYGYDQAPQQAGSIPSGKLPRGPLPTEGFMADPSAQLGIEVGRNALSYGQRYFGQNLERYTQQLGALRYYFQVSNSYVIKKLALVLFPWRHAPWSRQTTRMDPTAAESWALPCDDINAPDMYIPIMAATTYLVLFGLVEGIGGAFQPQILGFVVSKVLAIVLCELLLLKLFTYLLSASSSSLLDFFAYSGYKFVGITLTTLVGCVVSNSLVRWGTFLYTASALAFFMLRSLRYILLPESSSSTATLNSSRRQHRIQFLFAYSVVCQVALMWLLLPPPPVTTPAVPVVSSGGPDALFPGA